MKMFDDLIPKKKKKNWFLNKCTKCSAEWTSKNKDIICWSCGSPLVITVTKIEDKNL